MNNMDKDASAEALGWTLCAVLGLSYGLVAGVAGCRALTLRGRGHGGPWTTQKVLHLLVTLCAAARCAFFAHASTLWDWEAGTVSAFATPALRLMARPPLYSKNLKMYVLFTPPG